MNNNYDEMGNSELQQTARDIHGSLYKRINRLQRDLNIANAEVEKYRNLYNDMSVRAGQCSCDSKDKLDSIRSVLRILTQQ